MKNGSEQNWTAYVRGKMSDDSCRGISLYQRLAEAIQSAVISGFLPAGTRLPPDLELSEALGFSHITLGRALNELRKRGIVERSRSHGTFIANNAGEKQEQNPLTAAILFDDITPATFNMGLFQNLYQELSGKGYKILFFSAGGKSGEQADQLMDLMSRKQCTGAIVWSVMTPEDMEKVLAAKPAFWPLVFINTMFKPDRISADSVLFDNFGGFREIALRYRESGGGKIIFASSSFLLKHSLHKDYIAEMRQVIGEDNVVEFAVDRDPVSVIVNRKDNSLLCGYWRMDNCFKSWRNFRPEMAEPLIENNSDVNPQELKVPTLFYDVAALARQAVKLLDRRIASPQSACRHETVPYRFVNTEKIFSKKNHTTFEQRRRSQTELSQISAVQQGAVRQKTQHNLTKQREMKK